MDKFTKIGATIGPSCDKVPILLKMIKSGMDFARLNMSHGTYESHGQLIENIRIAEKKSNYPVNIMMDLRGPRIRLGILPEAGVILKEKKEYIFEVGEHIKNKNVIPVLAPDELVGHLKIKDRILINDGKSSVEIVDIKKNLLKAKVLEGGKITSHKGLNFPDSELKINVLSDKDKQDVEFGLQHGVDTFALSFVSRAQDVLDLKFFIKQKMQELRLTDEPVVNIVSKIERKQAVLNIDEIIDASDGVMVARGDLGLEMEQEKVPLTQKIIIDKANKAAKPVIVATQMLNSMQDYSRPSRAEVSDVANAVIDHSDGLLLTNETAVGKYPVLTVSTMTKIIKSTENSVFDDKDLPVFNHQNKAIDMAISSLSRILAEEVGAKLILAASISGETGRLISHVRPSLPILVATNTDRVKRQLNLSWGVVPFVLPSCDSIEELVERSMNYIKKEKIAKKGELMIVVAGEPVGQAGHVNLVEVREIK